MLDFFHQILYVPIYNLLIYLVGVLPGADVGLAVVIVTLIVKAVTFPLSLSAVKTQAAMRKIEPELKALREAHKDDKQKQAEEMFALYKKYGIRPFSSILLMLIQIPVLITLFLVFQRESMDAVNPEILYPFVSDPGVFSALFLGFFVIAGHNLILAGLAAITQFIQARYAIPLPEKKVRDYSKGPTKEEMGAEFGRAMAIQARFVLPIVVGFVAFTSGAVALYLITSNLVALLQEFIVRTSGLKTKTV
ncbi:MAG TPA: YidC/Oxa1 family membrane protein insertase [Candidatus Paceibacterota bacterium]|nr:YidC/Oxa1 family membrane protein insertase [Candidatus Paceibacterota bacterium]